MIKGVLFDLDGVIVETANLHYKAWKNLAKKFDIEIDEVFNETLKGVSRADSLKKILKIGNVVLSSEEFDEAMHDKNIEYLKMVDLLTEDDILPGILDFLVELKSRDIKIALASASKNGPMIIDKLNLSKYFDFIADPSLVPSKPDPGIFISACNGLNLEINECIGIEDATAGVEAITSAGMKSVGIGNLENCTLRFDSTIFLNGSIIDELNKN